MVMNALRRGAKSGVSKFLLFGLLVLATGGLVLTDVGGFFRGGVSKNDVAKIGNEKISIQQFDGTARRMLGQLGISPQEAYQNGFISQILGSEIRAHLLNKSAQEKNINIPDSYVAQEIQSLIAPYTTQGENPQTVLDTLLRNQGMTERAFVASISRDLGNKILENALSVGAAAPQKALVNDLYRFQNEKREIEYLVFSYDDLKTIPAPTEQQLKDYYEKVKTSYSIPERRQFKLIKLNTKDAVSKVDVSDEKIRQTYESNIDTYKIKETRTLETAIINDKAQAEAVAKESKQGKTLEQAVADVTGNKAAYMGERAFEASQIPEDIRNDVLAEKKAGTVIGPLETAAGFYVVNIKSVQPEQIKPFEDVKAEIAQDLKANAVIDEQYAIANTIDDMLAAGTPLEDIAKQGDVTIMALPAIDQFGFDANGKEGLSSVDSYRDDILRSGFQLQQGETSPLFETDQGTMIAVHVEKITPMSFRSLKDIQQELMTRWNDEQKQLGASLLADEAARVMREQSLSIADIAKQKGKIIKTSKPFKRDDQGFDGLTPDSIGKIFNADKGQRLTLPAKNGTVLAVIKSVEWPEKINTADENYKALERTLSEGAQQEITGLYLRQIQDKIGVRVNQALLSKAYGPEASSEP